MAEQDQDGDPAGMTLDENQLADFIPVVRSYLRRILRRDEIEDGVQTVLARALENLSRYRGESSPRLWVLGIARNVGYELARHRQKRPILIESEEEASTGSVDLPAPTQEELLGRKEQQALALAALDGLSLDDKLALLVTYVDGLPGPEAAEILGVSFVAFRQRLSRARQALARELERVMAEGVPGSAEVLGQWQALLDPHGRVRLNEEED